MYMDEAITYSLANCTKHLGNHRVIRKFTWSDTVSSEGSLSAQEKASRRE